jgi:CRISPR-associated protein Cmr3
MSTVRIRLDPLDVLFFRDGRPFAASARASTGLPTPQTLAGALRTALLEKYGCDFARLRGSDDFESAMTTLFPDAAWIGKLGFRGPWFARDHEGRFEVLTASPASLHKEKKKKAGRLFRLDPLPATVPLPGWPSDGVALQRPLWLKECCAAEPAEGLLRPRGLEDFLHGRTPQPDQHVGSEDLFDRDYRTGVAIEADRLTAAESMLYGISYLALAKGVGLYAEVDLPADAPEGCFAGIGAVALGGEGRRAELTVLDKSFHPWPAAPVATGKQRPVLLLTTPAPLSGGLPAGLDLVSAAVPAPLAVSGWDLARGGPRVLRFAAPAGSVYFLERAPSSWPAALAPPSDAGLGWGCYLKGVWTDD